ncbi:MAG: hypothetical protein SAK29_11395 [Scytonema sp. PMC 1069.18]|nr:hypothetical protein [Scytonema sp. PMC 1069.18]MEC4883609.1 hypothetical protein [Scytonema sp. PMC 1070.18]
MINRYTHLMHLVSNIKGILEFDGNAIDIIQVIFPSDILGSCLKLISPLHPYTPTPLLRAID